MRRGKTSLRQKEQIFWRALQLQNDQHRREYLAIRCASFPNLRSEIESLIAEYETQGGVLEQSLASLCSRFDQPSSRLVRTNNNNYQLGQPLGSGGMGSVFSGIRLGENPKQVAIKFARPSNVQSAPSIIAERRALARICHPLVVGFVDAGLAPNHQPFLVMDYLNGIPITEAAEILKADLVTRIGWMIDLCEAVAYIHSLGIIHCDIKPANVLIVERANRRIPILIDFGIWRPASRPVSRSRERPIGIRQGTPDYMAPERLIESHESTDRRSDLYSLGVMLYELLAGSPPRTRPVSTVSIGDGSQERFSDPQQRALQLPSQSAMARRLLPCIDQGKRFPGYRIEVMTKALDRIVIKCLDPRPAARPTSCRHLQRQLMTWLVDFRSLLMTTSRASEPLPSMPSTSLLHPFTTTLV